MRPPRTEGSGAYKRDVGTESSPREHRPPVGLDPARAAQEMPKAMGHLYPVGDILAVVDDRATAERLVEALKACGLAEGDVDLVDGAWFAQVMRANKDRWNPLQRGLALLAADEGEVIRNYL